MNNAPGWLIATIRPVVEPRSNFRFCYQTSCDLSQSTMIRLHRQPRAIAIIREPNTVIDPICFDARQPKLCGLHRDPQQFQPPPGRGCSLLPGYIKGKPESRSGWNAGSGRGQRLGKGVIQEPNRNNEITDKQMVSSIGLGGPVLFQGGRMEAARPLLPTNASILPLVQRSKTIPSGFGERILANLTPVHSVFVMCPKIPPAMSFGTDAGKEVASSARSFLASSRALHREAEMIEPLSHARVG